MKEEDPWGKRKPYSPNSPEVEKEIENSFQSRLRNEISKGFKCPICREQLIEGKCSCSCV
jgi:hypothetical protein